MFELFYNENTIINEKIEDALDTLLNLINKEHISPEEAVKRIKENLDINK